MSDVESIRTAFERNAKALALRPSIGQGTHVTKVRLRDGLACEIEDGAWKLTADLDRGSGGNDAGPDPGVFGRAALGSCLAIGYALWAAKLQVPLSSIEVEVHADYDARGMYAVDDRSAGWTDLRYTVSVASTAPEADVMRVLDEADAHSPLRDDFSRAFTIEREVRISAPVE
jgi:uncharacterized OsmC-like protein